MVDQKSPPFSQHLDLAAQVTEKVEGIVEMIRDRAVRPVLHIVRIAVLAVLVGLIGLLVLVIVSIALMRLFDVDVFGGRVWATYLLFGGMLIGAGVFLISKSGLRGSDDVT